MSGELVEAGPDDAPAIMALERGEGYEDLVGRWELHEHRRELENPNSLYLLWREEGRIRGFVMLQNLVNPHGGGRLRRVCVDRPGEGFGSRLLAATLDLAFGDLGLHRLDLMVFTDNERALRAYRRIGFVEEGVAREVHRTPEGGFRSMRLMSILAPEWKARV